MNWILSLESVVELWCLSLKLGFNGVVRKKKKKIKCDRRGGTCH